MSKDKDEEIMQTRQVQDNIQCKTCKFNNDGTVYSNDFKKGSCEKFPYPDTKPIDVLFEGGKCQKYEKK